MCAQNRVTMGPWGLNQNVSENVDGWSRVSRRAEGLTEDSWAPPCTPCTPSINIPAWLKVGPARDPRGLSLPPSGRQWELQHSGECLQPRTPNSGSSFSPGVCRN